MYYMFLADGFEETEALVTLDMMRRADIDVKTVGIGKSEITGAHRICVKTDLSETDFSFENCEGIILPGGMPGTENLFNCETVISSLMHCADRKLLIAAICAAPIIPGRKGLLNGKKAVCFPGFEEELTGASVSDYLCVTDDNFITAKGAGCVFEFSYQILLYVSGKATADNVIKTIQHKGDIV